MVAAAAQLACLLEASAPKPGNVSPGRHFTDARMYAITGRSGDDEVRKSLDAGFDGHLVKPLDTAMIGRLLAEEDVSAGKSTT